MYVCTYLLMYSVQSVYLLLRNQDMDSIVFVYIISIIGQLEDQVLLLLLLVKSRPRSTYYMYQNYHTKNKNP